MHVHSKRRLPWMAIVGILLLVYPISYGPVCALRSKQIFDGRWDYDGVPARATRTLYRPLTACRPLSNVTDWYFVWSHTIMFGPPPRPSPPSL